MPKLLILTEMKIQSLQLLDHRLIDVVHVYLKENLIFNKTEHPAFRRVMTAQCSQALSEITMLQRSLEIIQQIQILAYDNRLYHLYLSILKYYSIGPSQKFEKMALAGRLSTITKLGDTIKRQNYFNTDSLVHIVQIELLFFILILFPLKQYHLSTMENVQLLTRIVVKSPQFHEFQNL